MGSKETEDEQRSWESLSFLQTLAKAALLWTLE
jgi:hypothetical protein